jgi:RimK family alpha-L-glutamate ligase
MTQFAVVATRPTLTNTRLGTVIAPARALARLRQGDVALGRLDVLPTLDGVEPGLWALDRLAARGVTVLNPRRALAAAHDKLATANALVGCGLPHPYTVHIAPWLPDPVFETPFVVKPRYGSWGRDVLRCDTPHELDETLDRVRRLGWFESTGGVVQRLVEPRGYDLRIVVAGGKVVGAIKRVAARGEWRTNVALGGHREPVYPPAEACELALAAADAIGGDLVGVDLLPDESGSWTIIEVNGAVDFTGAYSLGDEIFAGVRASLRARRLAARYALAAAAPGIA